jgi:hypothetical protein
MTCMASTQYYSDYILWVTVSRPVCPGIRQPSGIRDQFLVHFHGKYMQVFVVFLLVGRLCWREDGSVIYAYNCYWALPALSPLGPRPAGLVTIPFCLISGVEWSWICYQRSVGQYVLVVGCPLGPITSFYMFFSSDKYLLLHVGRPLWREDGSVFCSAHHSPVRVTKDPQPYVTVSFLRLTRPGGPSPRSHIPRNMVAQLNPRTRGSSLSLPTTRRVMVEVF